MTPSRRRPTAPDVAAACWTVVGLRHGDSALALRERHALDVPAQLALLHEARAARLGPVLVLATCNRLELHAPAAAVPALLALWHEISGGDPAEFARAAFRLEGDAAVRWLMRVASGLDSQLVGESGIRCQLQSAHARSVACGVADAWLNRLVQDALAARKAVHAALGLTGPTVSHATLAEGFLATLAARADAPRDVLVVGGGHLAQNAARRLRRLLTGRIVLLATDVERAVATLDGRGIEVRAMRELGALAPAFDAIVTAAGGAGVLRREHLAQADAAARPRWVVDLGAPRNCDPALAQLPGIDLVDLESLPARVPHAAAPALDLAAAEQVIDARIDELRAWHERRARALHHDRDHDVAARRPGGLDVAPLREVASPA